MDLLQSTPARDIRAAAESILRLLDKVDLKRFLRKQGFINRFTGADVEAHLQFELASHRVMAAFRQVRPAADNGRRVRAQLANARAELADQQVRLTNVIAEAKALIAQNGCTSDEFVLSRFERRLANLTAMEASNILTLQQMALSESTLSMLLDTFVDIEPMLLPLWQRNALAIAQGEASSIRSPPAVECL